MGSMYWGEIPQKDMLQVLEIEEKKGYREALDFVVCNHPKLARFLLSDTRIDWLLSCYAQDHQTRCLDLGSGWGSLSFPLTKFYEEIVSLERVPERLKFQATRAKQDRAGNIRFVEADMVSLPFAENQFDLVVASGVLEWAAFMRSCDPRVGQLSFLREIRRCLRAGGCLYIGAENRFGIQFWLGARDHSSLRFTSILPRSIASLLVSGLRGQRNSRYDTYTYSIRGYRSLLKEAGFSSLELYWTYPSYNYPKFSAKLRDSNAYSFLARYHHRLFGDMPPLKRLASFVGGILPGRILRLVCPLIWPSFLILAWKDFRPESLEEGIARVSLADSFLRVSGGDGPCSNINLIALERGEIRSVSKLKRCMRTERLETEERLLRKYAGVESDMNSTGAIDFFTEKPILGRPCRPNDIADDQRAIRWLLEFQDETASGPLTEIEVRQEHEQLSQALRQSRLSSSLVERTLDHIEQLGHFLVEKAVPKCLEHGDFWPGNILISDEGKVSVLDWEFHKDSGNPVFDFCFFTVRNSARGRTDVFRRNLSGLGPYSRIMRDTAAMFCAHRRLPSDVIRLGIPYVLSRCISRYSVYSNTRSPEVYRFRHLLTLWNDQ